jgi:tetratricopeptide (TPR) repeat protein
MIDYYELLQVHPKASPEIIKKAYRTLLLELNNHPDRGGSADKAGQLNEAYAVLSDPSRRRDYDRSRRTGTVGGSRPLDTIIVPCPSCATKNRVKSLAHLRFAKCSRCGVRLTPASDRSAARDWVASIWASLPHRTCPSCQHRTRLLDRSCPRCGHGFKAKVLPAGLHRQPVLWFAVAGSAAALCVWLYWTEIAGLTRGLWPGSQSQEARVTAERLTTAGHGPGAIKAWQSWLQEHPDDADAKGSLGRLYLKEGETGLAIQYLQQALEAKPDRSTWQFALATAYHKLGNRPEAIRHFRRVTELDPTAGAAYFNLGFLLQAEGEADGAIQAYRRSSELEPDRADALVNLGVLLSRQNDMAGATIAFQQALKRQPNDPEAHYNLGLVYEQLGQGEAAQRHLLAAGRGYQAAGQIDRAKAIKARLDKLKALPPILDELPH